MSTRKPPKSPSKASRETQPGIGPRKDRTSRAEAAEATRKALLDAGEQLFAERGLDAPSLDDICAEAGYTRGAFYVHFKDRESFMAAVMERIGLPLLDELLGEPGAPSPPLAEVASRFLAAAASGRYPLTPKGSVRPHQLLDACARSPKIRRRYVSLIESSIGRVGWAVERGQADGWARDDVSARDVSTVLLALVIGAQTMLELGVPLDLVRTAGATLLLLRRPPPSRAA